MSLINKIFQYLNLVFLFNDPKEIKILSKFKKNIYVVIRILFDISILAEPINIIKFQYKNHTDNKYCVIFKVQKLTLVCDFKKRTLV